MNRLVAELNAYERMEDRLAYRDACLVSDAGGIMQDVIRGDECRREAYIEDVYCNERLCRNLLRDLLDDLKHGINPSETIRRSLQDWATGIASDEAE